MKQNIRHIYLKLTKLIIQSISNNNLTSPVNKLKKRNDFLYLPNQNI